MHEILYALLYIALHMFLYKNLKKNYFYGQGNYNEFLFYKSSIENVAWNSLTYLKLITK